MAERRFSDDETTPIVARLKKSGLSELDDLFARGEVPSFQEIVGETRGAWLAKPPEDYWWARSFIRLFLDSPWARWTGKAFASSFEQGSRGRGANLFNNRHRPRRYPLQTYTKKAEVDEHGCLTLEYPFPSLMYGLIDDVRKIAPGVFLGQMHYRFPWMKRRVFLGYFLLCALAPQR